MTKEPGETLPFFHEEYNEKIMTNQLKRHKMMSHAKQTNS